MTLSAVITPMTEKTPIVTPNIVRPERSLLLFSAVRAMRMISWKFIVPACHSERSEEPVWEGGTRPAARSSYHPPTPFPRYARDDIVESFVPQCLDRIQPRGRERRRETGNDSRHRRNNETGQHQAQRETHRK